MATKVAEHSYAPRGACKQLLLAKDSEVLISGPAGTGKSRAALEKLHLMALLNPGLRGLIVRKTASSLTSTALVTWRKFVINESLLAGDVQYYGGSAQEPAQFRYANGSTVVIGGMNFASRIMSSEYDVVFVQEATELTEEDWELITTRLRNNKVSFQQVIGDCNPSTPTHWLKQRCDKGQTVLLESRHEDNPVLFGEAVEDRSGGVLNAPRQPTEQGRAYLSKLDRLSGVRYNRLRKGLWVAAEGVIYDGFDPSVHLISEMPKGWETWTRYWAVDFGFTNPFVLQCWAEDPDGRLYLYREIYRTQQTVDVHARNILAIVAPEEDGRPVWIEPKPRAIVCDHDAEGRAQLERALHISTTAAHKKVTEGIQATQVRLKKAGDGRPRLFILRDAVVHRDPELVDAKKPTCTQEELPAYVWSDKKEETPVKEDDHGMDGMRYMVAHRDLQGRPGFRWLNV